MSKNGTLLKKFKEVIIDEDRRSYIQSDNLLYKSKREGKDCLNVAEYEK